MRKYNKLIALLLALTMVLSTAVVGFAEGGDPVPEPTDPIERPVETGFYVKGGEGQENLFIDIYEYLNGEYEQYITNAEKVLFVHQSGKGATLDEILAAESVEKALRHLDENDFQEKYKVAGTDSKYIKPTVPGYTFEANLDKEDAKYRIDEEIIVSGIVQFKGVGLKDVDITMKLGEEELVTVDQVKTGENGEFDTTLKLPENTEPGQYKLTVQANTPVNKSLVLELEVIGVDPTPTTVADDKITQSSTKIEGVDVEYKDGLLTISIDKDINWDEIVQDPNTDLGADVDVLYVGIHLERPNEEITHVSINDGTEDKVVELGKHAATTATGRYYYFGVAKKVTGEGEGATVTWETLTDAEAKTRTVKWYALEEEKEVLKAVEEFNVIRVLKEKEEPVDPTPTVVADGKITETSTKIDGVNVGYENGLLTIEIDEDINWDEIVQNPNIELGADADTLYVGIHLERPNEEITHVLINDGTGDKVVELGQHAATTATGRFYYFGVAKKVTGEGEGATVTWETLTDAEAKTRTVKWYALEEEKEVLKAVETFEVQRVLKEKEDPIEERIMTITPENGSTIKVGENIIIEAKGADDLRIMLWAKKLANVQAAKDAYYDNVRVFSARLSDLKTSEMTVEGEKTHLPLL